MFTWWLRRPHKRRHRERLAQLEQDLRLLADRAGEPGAKVLRLAPVIEVSGPLQYPSWRARRERLWRRAGDRNNTQGWPDGLLAGQWAAVLLPWPHKRTGGQSPGRLPLPAIVGVGPRSTAGALRRLKAPYEWVALGVLVEHVEHVREGKTGNVGALYAPPVIELWDEHGQTRRTLDLDLDWPLDPPEPVKGG
jgi:hypothetical protein